MKKSFLKKQIDFYNEHRGPFRKFFHWDSPPLRHLKRFYQSSAIQALSDDDHINDPLNDELQARLHRILNMEDQGGVLTQTVCDAIRAALREPCFLIEMTEIDPIPDFSYTRPISNQKPINAVELSLSEHFALLSPKNSPRPH